MYSSEKKILININNIKCILKREGGFPGGSVGKESEMQKRQEMTRFDPWSGRSPGGGHDNPFQYSCLENITDRGAWRTSIGSQRVGHD